MAIAYTIQSMYENVGDVYDTITNVDLPTNKNIQNIPSTMRNSYLEIMNNGIDKIWNNWEKVTGSGAELSLSPTIEAPMKINLKGNTSQETTTGSQLIDFTTLSNSNTTNSFINDTLTVNTSSGTYANAFKDITSIYKSNSSKVLRFDFTSLNSTTDLSGANGYVRLRIVKTDNSVTNVNLVNTDKSISTHTIPNDVSDISSVSLTIYANNTNTAMTNTVTINKPILHFGSTSTSYEPYTNGASPNPDYPQDIHVVSGDNEINVCGKNLIGLGTQLNGYVDQSTLKFQTNPSSIGYYFETSKLPNTITISAVNSNRANVCYFSEIPAYQSVCALRSASNDNPRTITVDKTYPYIHIQLSYNYENVTNIQIESGSTATTYEAYKSASYPINLGVENLYNLPNEETLNGITYTKNANGSINLIGTATANTSFMIYKDLATTNIINGNTYTLSATQSLPSGVEIRLEAYNGTTWLRHILNSTLNSTQQKITNSANTTNATRVRYLIYIANGTNVNITNLEIQLGTGTNKVSSTPIELCKIGDYQDSIKKSTGKNLFDKNTITENYRIGSDGLPYGDNACSLSDFIKVEPNTTYYINQTMSYQNTTALYDINKNYISPRIQSGNTFTTTSSTYYVRVSNLKANINTLMLNEGSTALPYEPYGKVWYLNKQIGKIVLDGTQNITLASSGTRRFNATYTTLGISNVKEGTSAEDTTLNYRMNDHFIYSAGQNTWGRYYLYNNWLVMLDSGSVIASASDLSTWLSNNNTTIYYVLATPTYTEITDSTLISQLETLKKAISYNEQTNISQENNDLPFILDVTALKQLN